MSIEADPDLPQNEQKLLTLYRTQIIGELRDICKQVLDLLTRKDGLISTAEDDPETKVFYLKMGW